MNADYLGLYDWAEKTIMIVEDDVSSIFYLKEVLADTNAEIIIVRDGQSAIDLCHAGTKPDIVLMDIQLPVVDGYTTTREIKKRYPNLPVIAQTAYAIQEEMHKCKEAGCDEYIAKPIDPNHLLETMKRFIG